MVLPSFPKSSGVVSSLLLSLLCLICGCADESQKQPRSVLDSLAEVEQSKKELETPPVVPATPAEPPAEMTSAPMDVASTGTFSVKFETSAGDFVVLVHRDWAPYGAHRFHELVKAGFYDDCRFFRVVENFMVQFGLNGNPATQRSWAAQLPDDPVRKSNLRGYITFATSGPNSRTTQVFINFVNNSSSLDAQGFSPFGEVIEGMDSVDNIYSGDGESPHQGLINQAGNQYLNSSFPKLDYIKKATIVEE